jgi:sulfonate transport system permease protein
VIATVARRTVRRLVLGLALPVALLAAWHVASRGGPGAAYAFVPLRDVVTGFVEVVRSGQLRFDALSTLREAFTGLVLGSLAGVVFGAALGLSRTADRLVGPLYHGLRQVPLMGLVPLIALWFGNGAGAKLVVVTLAAFYPVALATADGLRQVERTHLDLARALVLGRRDTFRLILLPSAAPSIITGVLQALAFTWIASVGSELLFSATSGLGGFMALAQAGGRMDLVIVAVTSIAVLGSLMNGAVTRLGRRAQRWRHSN